MAFRRQELSQRRKAVGFTQESLAEHLGVERSTVIRWEAGDSEPLPSIRPNLARALQVSIDQLAELLTKSENAGKTGGPSVDPEVTIPVLFPELHSQGRPGEAEFEDLIRPQIAETVEALRWALRSAGVSAEDLAAMLLVGGSSQVPRVGPGSDVPEPLRADAPNVPAFIAIPPDVESADVQSRRAKSRRRKHFAAAGVLALAAAWVSVPPMTSHEGAIPEVVAGTPEPAAPVPDIRAPNPGSGTDSGPRSADPTGAVDTSSTLNTPANGPALPAAATLPAAQTTKVTGDSWTASRSIPPAATAHPPLPRTPAWVTARTGADHRWDGVNRVDHLW